jgi:hypothetical protein
MTLWDPMATDTPEATAPGRYPRLARPADWPAPPTPRPGPAPARGSIPSGARRHAQSDTARTSEVSARAGTSVTSGTPIIGGVERVLAAWYRFAGPELPHDLADRGPEVRDRYRRARLLGLALLPVFIVLCIFLLLTMASYLGTVTIAQVATTVVIVIVILIVFLGAWLNRRGHVEAAGMLTAMLIIAAIVASIAAGDLGLGGYNLVDAQGWDVMLFAVTLVGLALLPNHAWLIYGVFLGALLALVILVPPDATVAPTLAAAGLSTADLPSPWARVVDVFNLTWHPVGLGLLLLLLGIAANRGAMAALRDRDIAADLARQRQEIIAARDQQRTYLARLLAALETALTTHTPFVPPDLPAVWQHDAEMVTIQGLLANAGRRLTRGQGPERALARLRQHMGQLSQLLERERASGRFADADQPPLNELLLITHVPEGTGDPDGDALLAALHQYLLLLLREEQAARDTLLRTIGEFGNGNTARRVDARYLPRRLGEIGQALNWLFGRVTLRGTGPSTLQTPFSAPE